MENLTAETSVTVIFSSGISFFRVMFGLTMSWPLPISNFFSASVRVPVAKLTIFQVSCVSVLPQDIAVVDAEHLFVHVPTLFHEEIPIVDG